MSMSVTSRLLLFGAAVCNVCSIKKAMVDRIMADAK